MTRRLLGLFVLLSGMAFAQTHVYELRTYTCFEGKLEDLKKRFRDHTIRIFQRHGMESIGYWVPQDAPLSQNTLVYLLRYPDRAAREKAWEDFRKDPEWIAARDASEANGKLVEKVDSVMLTATDYSPMK